MRGIVISAEDMQENVFHDGGNQTGGKVMVIEKHSVYTLTEGPSISSTCCVCLKETSGAYTFQKCTRNGHAICGHSTKDEDDNDVEGYGARILRTVFFNIENAVKNEMQSKSNLEMQANKIKRDSDKKFPPAPLGATVLAPLPDADKGRGDSRNLLAVVLNVTENCFYRLGTDQRILKQPYDRAEFTVCPKRLMKAEDVPDHDIHCNLSIHGKRPSIRQVYLQDEMPNYEVPFV
ncbi:integrase core domain protein [Plakobranchus ocellatus]|uniref:Integrase core domain protein n=1 Tax=Plakobranchus ocellatus TaxID=259542 RepID=A0AAV4AYQ7_9GAST|nr:integrase core domain protein [Plakobranchus ocellatus]